MALSKKPMSEAQKAALEKARAALNRQTVSANTSAPEKGRTDSLVGEVLELKRLLKDQAEQAEIRYASLMKQMDELRVMCQDIKNVRNGSATPDFLKKF